MANTSKQSLVRVQDELEDVAQLVQAIGMATRSLSSEDANPMLVLVDVTAKKLKAAADALEALRPQVPAVTARLGPKR